MDVKVLLLTLISLLDTVGCLPPIVIVPGIGGSQIEAKLNRNASSHVWCYQRVYDWFILWLSVEELLPWVANCWVENMRLEYDEKTGRSKNAKGVTTRVPDFGNTTAIEWLDPYLHGPAVYFYPFVDSLCRLRGYKRGKSLRAAPYDFRYDPSYKQEYFAKLKKLIEDTFYDNGNRRVVLTSHSMGVPLTLYFLKQQRQEWKDKFLEVWVTISGAFAGTVKAVRAYVSGDGFGIPSILDKPLLLRTFQRTFTSLPFLLPNKKFWKPDEVLVKTVNRTYTVDDFNDLFDDMGFPLAKKMYHNVPDPWSDEPPNVKMYCFHGANVTTIGSLTYPKGYFPDDQPDIVGDNGDGTVNIRSLQACLRWQGKQEQEISHQEFPYAEHNGILGDARLYRSFIKVLRETKSKYRTSV